MSKINIAISIKSIFRICPINPYCSIMYSFKDLLFIFLLMLVIIRTGINPMMVAIKTDKSEAFLDILSINTFASPGNNATTSPTSIAKV